MMSKQHSMTVNESLVISQRVVELVKKECKQMGINYSNRPLLIAAYASGPDALSGHDLLANDLAFDMGKDSAKDAVHQEPVEKETPLSEEPVTKTERQSFATMIAQQQEQIDKLIKASNANNTGALRLCDHVLDLNSRLEKKISKGELDERSSEIRKQVLEGFAHMADSLVKILNERWN